MKKASLILLVSCSTLLYSQIRYSGKIEPNLNINIGRTLTVDPTPYWQGYDLDHKQNGSGINFINGVMFREKFFAGLGVGYQNFYHADASPKNIHGAAFFFNGEYVNLEKPRGLAGQELSAGESVANLAQHKRLGRLGKTPPLRCSDRSGRFVAGDRSDGRPSSP